MARKVDKATKPTRGRPTVYTPEIARAICERIAAGETLRSICKGEGMPATSTVRGWALDNTHEFFVLSTRAYTLGIEELAEQCIEIADDAAGDWVPSGDPDNPAPRFNGEYVQRAKLRIETRMRLLGKWAPKRYGDKLAVGGADDLPPIKAEMSDMEVARRLAFALHKGLAASQQLRTRDCAIPRKRV